MRVEKFKKKKGKKKKDRENNIGKGRIRRIRNKKN